jgi:hypothetical protein
MASLRFSRCLPSAWACFVRLLSKRPRAARRQRRRQTRQGQTTREAHSIVGRRRRPRCASSPRHRRSAVLAAVAVIPLIPATCRAIVTTFVVALDGFTASFKAGKDLAVGNGTPASTMKPKLPAA